MLLEEECPIFMKTCQSLVTFKVVLLPYFDRVLCMTNLTSGLSIPIPKATVATTTYTPGRSLIQIQV